MRCDGICEEGKKRKMFFGSRPMLHYQWEIMGVCKSYNNGVRHNQKRKGKELREGREKKEMVAKNSIENTYLQREKYMLCFYTQDRFIRQERS